MRLVVALPLALALMNGALVAQSPTETAFFEQKVRPLLIEKCYACHAEVAKKQKGGLLLDSREAILKGGDSGPAVVVGEPAKSLLVKAIHYREADLQMPPKGKLTEREIETLEQWVKLGLPFPPTGKTLRKTKEIDYEAGRQFWSFLPLKTHEPPTVTNQRWPQQRIDHFILAELERRHLQPTAPAPIAQLLRRAKLDLLGLPPTREEIADFEADPSTNAFAKRLDTWLALPQYGERWSRFWLDLARYCDVAEQWTETKGQPYHYRDWVVHALNTDISYPRFLQLQLAADLMPDAKASDRAALGFIGLSPTYWKELQLPVEIIKTIVSDEYEERIHTLTSTFLGLNAACARCHDHKFDPISTADYYALAGVFANTKQTDQALQAGIVGERIAQVREQMTKLESELKKIQGKKGLANTAKRAVLWHKRATLQATPGLDATLIPGVRDASLHVIPAKGTHGSQVTYQETPINLALEIRGNPNNLGPVIPRRFMKVLSANEPKPFTQGSGRLELANALIRDAEGLLARVFVNRVWKQHFGTGLVETPSDFGSQGERPSHPQLLDDLAHQFVTHGWSMKWLHRQIMLSATYQQASGNPPGNDPANRLYATFTRRRMDVEAWRDSLFFVAGNLNLQVGGPPQELTLATNNRRTLYGLVRRRELSDLLRLYDFPDPVTHSPSRVLTTTPLQQLYTFNSPLMSQQAANLIKRLHQDVGADPTKRIERAYSVLFGRRPTPSQLQLGLAFVRDGKEATWGQYAQVLLGSNEFMFID